MMTSRPIPILPFSPLSSHLLIERISPRAVIFKIPSLVPCYLLALHCSIPR